ncbi:MAG TPA: serine hydrolase domain-containing protein, partial [Pirellulales bacterium]
VRDGKRLLSESSIRAMTTTQTGPLINLGLNETGYGFGWVTTRNSQGESGPVLVGEFGHGGAYHTNMWIDPERDLITVYLTQHADHPGVDGEEILEAFRTAAKEAFGRPGAKATSPDSSESRAK